MILVLRMCVLGVRRGRAGIGPGRGGACCLPCLPSAVTVWCDVRSRALLTPRIILKTHTSSPPDNLHSHAQSRAGTKPCQRSTTSSLMQSLERNPILGINVSLCLFFFFFFALTRWCLRSSGFGALHHRATDTACVQYLVLPLQMCLGNFLMVVGTALLTHQSELPVETCF